MNSKRLYFGLLALIGLLFIGLVAGTYGINSVLTGQANKLTGLKANSQALTQQQLDLRTAEENVKKYSSLAQLAKVVVPQDKNQAEAVREIVNIAAANGIVLASITFPTSSLGATVPSSTGTVRTTPVTANSAAANLSQLTQVKGIPGVYQLPITIVVDNNNPAQYSQLIGFLTALEHNRRTSQVASISLQPTVTDPSNLTFTLTINEYIKP
jgi:hypothetical protein